MTSSVLPLPHSHQNRRRRHPLTFLDLPEHFRISVYSLAGLVRPCLIELTSECSHSDPDVCLRRGCNRNMERDCPFKSGSQCQPSYVCHAPRPPLPLLLGSKKVYGETSNLLYSTNTFWIRPSVADLQILNRLSSASISSMKSLQIDLVRQAWNNPSPSSLIWWSCTMGRLGRCFTPGQVYFSISIDTHDYSTTKKLLHPVLQYFPRLRECAIRLKLDPEHQKDTEHHRMQSLAETTALKLLHSHERADTFPFLKLPLELRHLVLEQLPSLATQRSSGGIGVTQIFEPFTRHCYHYADHPYEVFDHLARDFYSCCGKCNNRRGATTGCFCREIGISYSSTCVCDRMEPLLKINRQLNYEVREFLFSRNIIRLADSNWHAMNIKTFLRTLPRTLLPRINKLELIVSYYNYKRWITDEEEKDATEDVVRDTIVEKCDWPSLIRFIRYNMSVERMDLYIKLPDSFYHWYKGTWQNDEKYWPHWQKAYHIQYQALLDSLQQLQTLRRFFVYFGDCDWEELDVDSETKIEKLVMGDHYDSSKSGKPEFPCTEFDDNMA